MPAERLPMWKVREVLRLPDRAARVRAPERVDSDLGVARPQCRGLAWFRLQEPFGQQGRPRMLPDDPVDGKVLVLLIMLNRRFGE